VRDQARGNPPDVPFVPVGLGLQTTFKCPLCLRICTVGGRRKRRVQGLAQFVCVGCVTAEAKEVAA